MTEQDSTPLNGRQKERNRSTGTVALSLGIFSVACMIAVSTPVLRVHPAYQDLSMVLGIFGMGLGLGATLVAMRELRRISKGIAASSQKASVIVGMLLGILGWAVMPVMIALVSLFSAGSILPYRDAMIEDFNNIAAHAYQYKNRPASKGGGEGCYNGYVLPGEIASGLQSSFLVTSVTCTTVTVEGRSIVLSQPGRQTGITVVIDRDGRLGSWTYTGDFQ